MTCAVCGLGCCVQTSRRYSIGPLDGDICCACEASIAPVITRWMSGRPRELRAAANAAQALSRTLRLVEKEAAHG